MATPETPKQTPPTPHSDPPETTPPWPPFNENFSGCGSFHRPKPNGDGRHGRYGGPGEGSDGVHFDVMILLLYSLL